jgi:hypothetical protein
MGFIGLFNLLQPHQKKDGFSLSDHKNKKASTTGSKSDHAKAFLASLYSEVSIASGK